MRLTAVFLLMFFIAPQAFAQFTLTASPGQGKVDLSWTAVSGAAGYDLYFCENTGNTDCTVPTSGDGYLGWITTTTYEHTGLSAGTTYRYQVTHYVGGTVRSSVASATTPPELAAGSISDTAATLTLSGHSAAWWYKGGQAGASCTSVNAGTTTASLSGLTASTSYTYKAYDTAGCADANEIASVTFSTLASVTLAASAITPTTATLTLGGHSAAWWYQGDQAAASCTSVSAGTTTASLSGLTGGTSYTYKAYSASGCGSADEIASVTFSTLISITLTATPGQGKVDLSWTAVTGAEGYDLYFCEGASCTVPTTGSSNPPYLGWQTGTTYEHTGLSAGTTYRYQVTHYVGDTVRSNVASATTPPELAAGNISDTAATLTLSGHTAAWWYKGGQAGASCTSVSAGTTTASLSGLTASTSYTYKAYDTAGCADANEIASVTFSTLTSVTLAASAITPTTATLTLSGHSAAWWYQGDQSGASCTSVSAGTTTASLSGLTANTSYTYKAYDTAGCASADEIASVTFSTEPAPITLTTTPGQGKVDLSWTMISGAEGYDLYFCENTGNTDCTVPTTGSSNPPYLGWITTTTYEHTGLSAGTTYRYQVTHYVGGTVRSNVASATTPPELAAGSISATTATLTLSHSGNWYYKETAPTSGSCSAAQTSASVNLSNLRSGISYTYKAYSDSGCSTELASVTFATLSDLNLRITASNSSAITLSWTQPVGQTGGYDVYRCTVRSDCMTLPAPTGTAVYMSWVENPPSAGHTATKSGNTFTLVDTDAAEKGGVATPIARGETYYYAILGYSPTTAWSYATAQAGTALPAEPARPVGLVITSASAEAVSLRWKSSSGNGERAGYGIYRCTVPEGEATCDPYDGLWLAYLDNTNTYTDTEVTPGEAYRYQVAAENLQREDLSRAVTVTVGAQISEMAPSPTGLTVTEATESLVELSWTAPEDDGKGPIQAIHIYRCNVDRSPDCSQFLHLASWNPVLAEYTDANVESGATYRYAVAAYRSADEVSPWSNQVTVTTEGYATPTDFTVTGTYSNAISLSWVAPADGILGYNIYRCSVSSAGENCEPAYHAWVANPGDTPPAPTSYTDTGGETGSIVPGTTYRYQVAASLPPDYRNGDRSGAVTATAQGEPLPDEPGQPMLSPPTGLTVTAVSETSVSLSWTAPADGILGYNVYRCSVPGGETTCELQWHAWVANEGDAPPAPTSYTDTGGETGEVIEGAIYLYAVAASYPPNYTASELSETVITHELEPEILFPAPTGLRITATSAAAVGLSWTAPAGGISGYNVYRCSVPEGETTCGLQWHAWVANEGDAPPAPTSYTDTGGETGEVIEGATYLYAVAASYPPDYTESELSEALAVVARQGAFEASFESGHQWFRRDVIPKLSGNAAWDSIAWKGERIQQHILVNNVPSDSYISLASSDLTGVSGTIPAGAVSFRYPRFVKGDTEVRTCAAYPDRDTASYGTSYLSDALFSEPVQTLPASWPELVWMSVDIPADTAAGEYAGTVTVSAVSGETTAAMTTLQVSIEVVPWTMPDAADRQFHLDLWQFPVTVLDLYNAANPDDKIKVWSEEHYALLEPTYRYLAGLGQRVVTTYIKEGAFYRGTPSMIQWTLKSGGAWEYDYSVFDAYVTRLASWGLDQQINAVSPRGWNPGDIPYWDEATQTKKTFSADEGSPAWNERWRHFLTDFGAHLLEKGWFDKTVLYLDEARPAQVQSVIDLIDTLDGNWKIGLAYIGSGQDGPGENILNKLYDRSGSLEWRSAVGTTYVDTGLVTGVTYRYAVDAVNDGASAASPPVTMVAQFPVVPGEPTGLTAATSATGVTLDWAAPAVVGSSPLIGYNIYRCADGAAPCTPEWFDRVEAGATYTDSGVTANTAYRYTVTACNGSGCGNRSGEITVMTGGTVNPQSPGSDEMTESDQAPENQAVPPVPTNLTALAASATAIQLGWEGYAATGFDVYRCAGSETCTPEAYLGWSYADNHTPDPDRVTTFYTSCAQPRPNSFVAADADPTDLAALPWHALQRRLDGYLRWAFDNWRLSDPLDLREFVHTAGDFSLVYRSSNNRGMTVVPSVRSELLRDGIEDFEKVQVLRKRLSTCSANDLARRWLARLERTVDTFAASPLVAGRAGDLIGEAHDRLGEISVQLTPGVCQ